MSQTVEKTAPGVFESPDEHNQYLTFKLVGEMFAISIRNIREIIEHGNLTAVPMMPEFVRGVMNLRGSVVPVIDLAARFGRATGGTNRRSCIVIVEIEGQTVLQEIGVIVDEVSEVIEIPSSEIEPVPTFGTRIRTDFISGMGKVNGGFVIMLNVKRVLDIEEIAKLSDAVDDTKTAELCQ